MPYIQTDPVVFCMIVLAWPVIVAALMGAWKAFGADYEPPEEAGSQG